ncbi:MAG: hypothetical protein ACYDBQ_08265 [Thermoplasmatota archaeon]
MAPETSFAAATSHQSLAHPTFLENLNGRWHKPAMLTFLAIALAHWSEHLVQAWQIWGMGMAPPHALGILGMWFPWLVTSEVLHFSYAIVMLAFLFVLQPAMVGRARLFWNIALGIQVWHAFEHVLLFLQAAVGTNLYGQAIQLPQVAPLSILQMFFPRVQLHLFYNAVVFIPMVIGMWYHTWPPHEETARPLCNCVSHGRLAA